MLNKDDELLTNIHAEIYTGSQRMSIKHSGVEWLNVNIHRGEKVSLMRLPNGSASAPGCVVVIVTDRDGFDHQVMTVWGDPDKLLKGE